MNILVKIILKCTFYFFSLGFLIHACYHLVEFGNHYYAVVFEDAHMHNLGTCSLPYTSLITHWLFLIIGILGSLFICAIELDLEDQKRTEEFNRWRNSKL